MKISLKPYTRRDGSVMFYLNNDRGVSLGLSAEREYQSSKASAGQAKLWSAFCRAVRLDATMRDRPAVAAAHAEPKLTLFTGTTICATDTATVGGVSVGADGSYAIREDGAILAFPVEVETE
jgi:hypothetical protein